MDAISGLALTGLGSSGWRRENASRRCVSAAARLAEVMAPLTKRWISPSRPLDQALLHQIERADDSLQQIVEVVSDAASELSDGLHLLRLAQRLLGAPQRLLRLLLIGDVARNGIDHALVRCWPSTTASGRSRPCGAGGSRSASFSRRSPNAPPRPRLACVGIARAIPTSCRAARHHPSRASAVAAGLTLSQTPPRSATTSRSCDTFQMRSRSRVRASTWASSVSFRPRSSISACLAAVMS